MTAAEMIEALNALDPATEMMVATGLGYVPAGLARISSTEYCLAPVGVKKAAVIPDLRKAEKSASCASHQR